MRIIIIICIIVFFLAGTAWVNIGNKPTPLKVCGTSRLAAALVQL